MKKNIYDKKKKPWVAGLLNLLIWGLGYIYNGKRTMFGVMLLISALGLSVLTMLPSPEISDSISDSYTPTATDYQLEFITNIFSLFLYLLPIAFAYDAYKEAQEINQRD